MKTTTTDLNKIKSEKQDNFEIGRQFEQFIIQLFDKFSFQIEQYRESKKFPSNEYFPDYGFPDLEMKFGWNKKYRFAVECKWQSKFRHGKINWASPAKIQRYKKFVGQYGIPVFIAIGIGGKPSNPDQLFVTPLINIQDKPDVYEFELNRYERKQSHRFYYHTIQLKLY